MSRKSRRAALLAGLVDEGLAPTQADSTVGAKQAVETSQVPGPVALPAATPPPVPLPASLDLPSTTMAQAESIQARAEPSVVSGGEAGVWWFGTPNYSEIAPWWSRQRDVDLRSFVQLEGNDILQSCIGSMVKKFKSMSWVLEGPEAKDKLDPEPGTVDYHQRVLSQAEFGEGWGELLTKSLQDYFSQDQGTYWELTGPGDPAGPIQSCPTGVECLDAQYVQPTGDPTYPILFHDPKRYRCPNCGTMGSSGLACPRCNTPMKPTVHKIHATRMVHLVDLRSPNQEMNGVGFCLYRDSTVLMASGKTKRIVDLVSEKSTELVISVDDNGRLVEKAITGWYTNQIGTRKLINLRGEKAKLVQGCQERNSWLTDDHPVLTPDGWRKAGELKSGDFILTSFPTPNKAQTEFLIGTLLGDSSLLKGQRTKVSIGHCLAQEEWFRLKEKVLAPDFGFTSRYYDFRLTYKGETKVHPGLSGETKSQAGFLNLRDAFYDTNRCKIIPLELLKEHLSPLLLATWYLDDGNIVNNYDGSGKRGGGFYGAEISTCGFAPEEVRAAADILSKAGYSCFPVKARGSWNKALSLRFLKDGAAKLFADISPYVPTSLRYKLPADMEDNFTPELWELGCAERLVDKIEVKTKWDRKGTVQTVYCIDVEDTHNFVTAGLVVHNCAVSRTISSSQILLKLMKYQNEKLSDLPQAGLLLFNNILPQKWADAQKQYEVNRKRLGQEIWMNIMTLFGYDPANPVDAKFLSFASLPDGFNQQVAYDIYVKIVALSFGVDIREFWPVSGSPMGTSMETLIMHQKARGKGVGEVISTIERAINWKMLPSTVSFRFQFEDDEEERLKAEIQQIKVATILSMYQPALADPTLSPATRDEVRQMLADETAYFRQSFLSVDTTDQTQVSDTLRKEYHLGRIVRMDELGRVTARLSERRKSVGDVLAVVEQNYKAGRVPVERLADFAVSELLAAREAEGHNGTNGHA